MVAILGHHSVEGQDVVLFDIEWFTVCGGFLVVVEQTTDHALPFGVPYAGELPIGHRSTIGLYNLITVDSLKR
jgi:hypothetical protein